MAIAFRVRTLLTSATFRPYSGAEKEAPIETQVFLHNVKRREEEEIYIYKKKKKLDQYEVARRLLMHVTKGTNPTSRLRLENKHT